MAGNRFEDAVEAVLSNGPIARVYMPADVAAWIVREYGGNPAILQWLTAQGTQPVVFEGGHVWLMGADDEL